MLSTGQVRSVLLIVVGVVFLAASSIPVARGDVGESAACATALPPSELATIQNDSDTATLTGNPLRQLETGVDRLHRITRILVAHHDRRGIFPLGLDAVEQTAVMPLQHAPAAFAAPDYAHAISLDLLRRFLANLHAEFTGGPLQAHWARYFELARQCDVSPARVAMVGYNAHLTVDLAYTVAAAGSRPDNAPDYFTLVDAIARAGFVIIDRTKAAYDADLGPLWRFYFVGEGLDELVGRGVATGKMLEAADLGYNVAVFGNGLALQNPAAHDATVPEIHDLFGTVDLALEVLTQLRGL
jgi:hypothetical protein